MSALTAIQSVTTCPHPLGEFASSMAHFEHIHADIIGPLSVIDRFTRWPKAHPLQQKTTEEITEAVVT